jgi:hypothetical protein
MATMLVVVMFMASFGATTANAGLFTKIKDAVKNNPVKSALVGVAAVGGTILAAPYIATALGFAGGSISALAGGGATAVAAAGSGLAAIGSTIWGGVCAAGGFVTGVLGAIGGAIGSVFSGIAGFVGGIIGSPLFVPALCLVGAAVAGYFLYKHYKRQKQTVSNSNNIPTISVAGSSEVANVAANNVATTEIPVSSNVTPAQATDVTVTDAELTPVSASSSSSDELTKAHSEYIKAYNKYINLVTNVGGSENPDEEVRSNMLRSDTQSALTEYREAYNRYVTLLRQSNSN